jgi:hypothetical protein
MTRKVSKGQLFLHKNYCLGINKVTTVTQRLIKPHNPWETRL